MSGTTHKPLPKSWKTAAGFKIEMIGGKSGELGQWLRMTEPFDPEIPMSNGETYRLVRNYPAYRYEWVYVLKDLLEEGKLARR